MRGNGGGIRIADWYQPELLLSPMQMDLLFRVSRQLSGDDALIMDSIINLLTVDAEWTA